MRLAGLVAGAEPFDLSVAAHQCPTNDNNGHGEARRGSVGTEVAGQTAWGMSA